MSNTIPMTRQEIGERIKIARNAKRITQQELAKLADVSQATVSDAEAGKGKVGLKALDKIVEVVGITVCLTLPEDIAPE